MTPEIFSQFARSMPDPLLLIEELGTVLAINSACAKLLKRDTSSVVGKQFHEFLNIDNEILKQYFSRWSRSSEPVPGMLTVLDGNEAFVDCRCWGHVIKPRSSDTPALILLRGQPKEKVNRSFATLNGKIEQLQREIAERRRDAKALLESQEQVRLLLDSTSEGIFGMDLNGNCTFINPACVNMLGYRDVNVILGKNMHDLIQHSHSNGNHYPASECHIYQANIKGEYFHTDDEIFWRKDKSYFPVEFHASPIKRKNIIIGSVVTFNDITERKISEYKLKKLNNDLELRVERRTTELKVANNHLIQSLEQLHNTQSQLVEAEKMAALGNLVAGIAHEINTPVGIGLTAASHLELKVEKYIKNYNAGELTRTDFEALLKTVSESSDLITANLTRAADLIRSFKQVAVDQTSEQPRSINIKNYVGEILKSLGPRFRNSSHNIRLECPEDLETYSQPGAISQLITNFVINSLVHGFEDMEKGDIHIKISQVEGKILLFYTDNGKGIPEEYIKKVFDPFFTTKRNQGGSGLGLHIAYNLVTQTLQGKIECVSSPGQGVTFQVCIPVIEKRLCA